MHATNSILVKTADIEKSARLAHAILRSDSGRVGRIVGEPGTGKTAASHWLAQHLDGCVRVCASAGITHKTLMMRLAQALNVVNLVGSADTLLQRCAERTNDRLIVIDEANHLGWSHMERLRYLPDETGAGLLLVGTDLLVRPFADGRTAILLAQLARRIGAKQLVFKRFSTPKQIAAYVIAPRFGTDAGNSATVSKAFHEACRGYWGEAVELADACQRILDNQQNTELTVTVIAAAQRWMAQR